MQAKLIGINQASTFTGFCAFHDNQTFEPIENGPFQSNQEHTFLLAYRTICKELFLKRGDLELMPFRRSLDRGKSKLQQVLMYKFAKALEMGGNAALSELDHYKIHYDQALLSSDYSKVRYYVIYFDRTPDFVCAGAMLPDYDFRGRVLQDLGNLTVLAEHITFSLIPTDKGGAAIFSWNRQSNAAKRLVSSLHGLPNDQLPHAIMRLTFEYFENVYLAPQWWESLTDVVKQKLVQRQMTGAHPEMQHSRDSLQDDGLRIIDWVVTSRQTNLTF